ncbi:hypothetical protein [uncultured Chryseobacterium sp.]|uniref:hypothetical protein n=1 Tax=uncultured Chryseobacterium sp. TaxID=259322 RepID=UPI0025D791E1|nr:hypothetical protein [uncultured Chryseobacterium sp.]
MKTLPHKTKTRCNILPIKKITEAEYNSIKSQLAAISVIGSSDAQPNANTGLVRGIAETRSIGTSQPKAPASSFLVAFAVSPGASSFSTSSFSIKLKYNNTASPTSGYADYANGYAILPLPASGKFYFVIKRASRQSYGSGDSYVAYYCNSGALEVSSVGNVYYTLYSDANNLSAATSGDIVCLQILGTTVKQW